MLASRILVLAVVASGCLRVPAIAKPPQIPREPLPDIFAPLAWTTTPESVEALFPRAQVARTPGFAEPFWRAYESVSVETVEVPILGRGSLALEYVSNGGWWRDSDRQLCSASIHVPDPRAECRLREAPDGCWRRPAPQLLALFNRARRELERRYGKPQRAGETEDQPSRTDGDALPPTHRASQTLVWPRDGFELGLDLVPVPAQPEDGDVDEDSSRDRWELVLRADLPEASL